MEAARDQIPDTTARVLAVQDDLVTISAADSARPLIKNEVVLICPSAPAEESGTHRERLKAEVLRIEGSTAVVQVFENTRGVAVGDPVIQTGELLSVTLGPGLLGQLYDGLQNPLESIAAEHGFFLPRGVAADSLDQHRLWSFTPTVRVGDRVRAGDVLGVVPEGRYEHKIMVPFDQQGDAEVTWIQAGNFNLQVEVARIRGADGQQRAMRLAQTWPVRRSLTEPMLKGRQSERLYPDQPLLTTMRLIDSFFPVARGGTACIPGPFGAGKTVLQNLISRYTKADIVVIIACGERAGEVVETITEFPKLTDPHTGGSLMDRTILICNTSSMPVAAREASIYTGITIGEYYRQMGHDVLVQADSTTRWAQAMREMSGRMEEIPGEEAFPAYLDSAIRSVYERAGVVRTNDGDTGSLTMIGTVSPAGGNFEEPVTQATLSTVKTFLALSADRAYKRFYPAIEPLTSWSRYLKQLSPWYEKNIHAGWTARIMRLLDLLRHGDEIRQMMQVTGEEGISIADFVEYQKATFLDLVYLQQDAFNEVDATVSLERQQQMLELIDELVTRKYEFASKDAARDHFTQLTNLFKNLNYAREDSPEFKDYLEQIRRLD
ncbi:MAG: V-type ATP synthase subunit A [Gammaproteobacteria bacterium]|nr:V-type ATP synthase subunit A [Gammaproteobacteria bacterium]